MAVFPAGVRNTFSIPEQVPYPLGRGAHMPDTASVVFGRKAEGAMFTSREKYEAVNAESTGPRTHTFRHRRAFLLARRGVFVVRIYFYKDGEVVAGALCSEDGTPARDILAYTGRRRAAAWPVVPVGRGAVPAKR